jgi:hypothetical protein
MYLTQVTAMPCGFAAQNPQYVRAKPHYLSEMHRPKQEFIQMRFRPTQNSPRYWESQDNRERHLCENLFY